MMGNKIIIVSAVYPPEPIVSARTSAQVAEALLKQNHKVQVITAFPNRPKGEIYPGFHRHLYQKSIFSGQYSTVRCFSTFSKNSTAFSRFFENTSLGVTSGLALLFSQKSDVIYANTWPIFATGIVRLVASLRRIPLVISIQDVYPESLLSQGRMKEGDLIYKILLSIDRWIAKGCQTIIPISERFAGVYRVNRGISAERIKVIPNWMDKDSVIPGSKLEYRKEKGIPEDAFVLVYGGNIGMAAGVRNVLQAMKQLHSERKVVFVIAGSGSQLATCQKLAAEITDVQILFHTPWAVEETSKVLAAADALVLPTSGDQSLASVPSKMISYLLAARPILAIVRQESDIAEVIRNADCGWVVQPESPELLAKIIKEIVNLTDGKLDQMGKAGRNYALQTFVSEVCLHKVIENIECVGEESFHSK
jgi:glycosyltransferase involved in cell wall biosynthesis